MYGTNPLIITDLETARQFAELNDISPRQLKEILKHNTDPVFLADEILDCRDKPDVEYLIGKYGLNPTLFHNRQWLHRQNILCNPRKMLEALSEGDCAGAPFEFVPADRRTAEPFAVRGEPTDDTYLAEAICKAIEADSRHPDFRGALLQAHREHPDAGYGYSFNRWATGKPNPTEEEKKTGVVDNGVGYHSKGNGCVVRASCIPAYYRRYRQMIRQAVDSCMVTHNHTEAVKAVIVWCSCIWMLLSSASLDVTAAKQLLYEYVQAAYSPAKDCVHPEWGAARKYIFKEEFVPTAEENDDSLFAGYAVCMAVDAFCKTNDVIISIKRIAEGFCDADTLCAMEVVLAFCRQSCRFLDSAIF